MVADIGKYNIVIQVCVRKNDDSQDNLAHNAVEIQVLQETIQQMKSEDYSKRKLLKRYGSNTPKDTSWNDKQSCAKNSTTQTKSARPSMREIKLPLGHRGYGYTFEGVPVVYHDTASDVQLHCYKIMNRLRPNSPREICYKAAKCVFRSSPVLLRSDCQPYKLE